MLKRILLGFVIVSVTLVSASHPISVHAAASDVVKQGICDANGGCPTNSPKTINDTISTVVNLLTAAVGVAAVIMIIVGGFRYVTSSGNAESAKSAKNTILYALIGLVVVGLSQVIVHFVLFRLK